MFVFCYRWYIGSAEVNAYYSPIKNQIGILISYYIKDILPQTENFKSFLFIVMFTS